MIRRALHLLAFLSISVCAMAQINTERVMIIGRNALYFEDYVLSIQYFNQVINAKPYLYEPYFYRGLAKFYLEDYGGAEADCTEAIDRNPYQVGNYEVRGLSRINMGKFTEAQEDYRLAIAQNPESMGLYQNLFLCHMSDSTYEEARKVVDKMVEKWPRQAKCYTLKADLLLHVKDTTQAVAALDKALELDPYEGQAWSGRAILSMSQQEYDKADEQFTKAIHLLPKSGGNYINRALCRSQLNRLGEALNDYDVAVDLEPKSYIAHYNRALLRAQLGDDNRAIEDFNFVLQTDPEDYMALYNRATLLEQTGDLKGAVRDYTTVIDHFPDFWTGLLARAQCKRKMGDIRGAEKDEFAVTKAQMEKRYEKRTGKFVKTRKLSDKDLENYNSMVVEDETHMERKYSNEYRGRVQDRTVSMDLEPIFVLSYYEQTSDIERSVHYHAGLDELNMYMGNMQKLMITNREATLDEAGVKRQFAQLDRVNEVLASKTDRISQSYVLVVRAVNFYLVQDLENALKDLDSALELNPRLFAAYFVRSMIRSHILEVGQSAGKNADTSAKLAHAFGGDDNGSSLNVMREKNLIRLDLDKSIALQPDFVYAYYNRAAISMENRDYRSALSDYDRAISIDPDFKEAYYNRGLCRLSLDDIKGGIQDLSHAGEMGLYKAYTIIKRYSGEKE